MTNPCSAIFRPSSQSRVVGAARALLVVINTKAKGLRMPEINVVVAAHESPIDAEVAVNECPRQAAYAPCPSWLRHAAMFEPRQKAGERRESITHDHRILAELGGRAHNAIGTRHSVWGLRFRTGLLVFIASLVAPSVAAQTPLVDGPKDPSGAGQAANPAQPAPPYIRPTETIKLQNYFFDAFGPYPIAGAALAAGISQISNTPPEWRQGAEGYGKRFGSYLGIAATTTTTRYALAEAFREDTLYYRCECAGALPRLKHAVISSFSARRGGDGHRIFSFPSIIAPYAGTVTAVYGWYPSRYGAKDAFRMGNYNLLASVGGNIALEFLGGAHSLFSRLHLKNRHAADTHRPNP